MDSDVTYNTKQWKMESDWHGRTSILRTCNIQTKTIQILNNIDSDHNLKQYMYMVE